MYYFTYLHVRKPCVLGGGRLVMTGGGWQWPRPAAKVDLVVTDAPEPPRFDSEHYQFTVSEFAREGK